MKTVSFTTSAFAFVALALLCFSPAAVFAADLDREKKALDIIAEFAEKLCSKIPIVGSSQSRDMNANFKAELKGVVKKIADLGFKAAAQYSDSKYEGLLQSDLTAAIKSNTDCRLQIWHDLKDKLIAGQGYGKQGSSKAKNRLSIVDARFSSTSKEFPVLDIKLRNTGEVAYIKRAVIKVKSIQEIESPDCPMAVPASWNYDVKLPTTGAPLTVEVDMSQSIRPQDVDRFTLTLGNDGPPGTSFYAFRASLDLIFDEDNKLISIKDIAFASSPAADIKAATECKDPRPIYVRNSEIASTFATFSGPMNTLLKDFLQELEKSIVPELMTQLQKPDINEEEARWHLEYLFLLRPTDKNAQYALESLLSGSRGAMLASMAKELFARK